jgi:hypothetical protein
VRRNEDAATNAPICELENVEHSISPSQLCPDQVHKWPTWDEHEYQPFVKPSKLAEELVNMDNSSFYKMC